MSAATCPECGTSNLYRTTQVSAGGGYAPNYLPGLGTFFSGAKFELLVCRDCGLTRFYADKAARERLPHHTKWTRA